MLQQQNVRAAVLKCQRAAAESVGWKDAVQAVAQVFSCDMGGLFLVDPSSNSHVISETLNHTAESVLAYQRDDVEDVWIAAAIEQGIHIEPRPLRGSAFVEFEVLTESVFYKECLQPNGIIDTLAFPFATSTGLVGNFLVHATPQHGFFTDEHVELATELYPFIVASLEAHAAIIKERKKLKLASLGLSTSHLAFYLFDRDRNLLFASDHSKEIGAPIITADGRLSSPSDLVLNWLRTAIADLSFADNDAHICRFVAADPDTKEDYVLQLSPYLSTKDISLYKALEVECFALLLRPASSVRHLDVGPVGKELGFTATEIEIVGALIEGASVEHIAIQRGSNRSTIRWHVKNALAKSGCQRQVDMIIKLQSLSFPRKRA